uniref:Uncharacterized protein n=1 Tax=Desulfovibrio sp. U5L TaxID=596152 RepID=I2Q3V2_9BACT
MPTLFPHSDPRPFHASHSFPAAYFLPTVFHCQGMPTLATCSPSPFRNKAEDGQCPAAYSLPFGPHGPFWSWFFSRARVKPLRLISGKGRWSGSWWTVRPWTSPSLMGRWSGLGCTPSEFRLLESPRVTTPEHEPPLGAPSGVTWPRFYPWAKITTSPTRPRYRGPLAVELADLMPNRRLYEALRAGYRLHRSVLQLFVC